MVDNKNTTIKNISQWQCPTCGEMNDSNNSFCTNWSKECKFTVTSDKP